MNNLYKEAMDEINISDQCLRKVKSMNNNNKKIKKFRLKYAVVFATLVLSFFAFNIVSYAATGKDLTSHISNKRVRIMILLRLRNIKLTMIQRLRLKNIRKIWTKTILKLIPIQAKMVMLK